MSLATKAAGSFLWATMAGGFSRVVTIVSTFVLTRYLAPEVQGEVNLAVVFVATAGAASAFGVGQYVAAHPKEGRETAFHGTIIILVTGVLACLACVAGAATVAGLLHVPRMADYVPGLALAHYLERCGWVPRSILVREMRFRTAAMRVAIGEVAFAASSVALAGFGLGGSAIVGGNLVRASVGLVFLLAVTDFRDHLRPCRLALSTARRILRFGLPMTVAAFFRLGATSWDNSFMGFRFGEGTVGVYNQAYRLAEVPCTSVGDQINDVLVPTFARLEDPEARRRGFLRAAALMGVLIFPMAFGLAAVAPTLTETFYPPAYAGVAPFLMVLASLSIARSFSSLAGAFLQAVGRTRSFIFIDLALVVSVLGLMTLLSSFGAIAASVGVALAFLVSLALTMRALRSDGITLGGVLVAASGPMLACIPMVVAAIALRVALRSIGAPSVVVLLAQVLGGAVVYAGASFVVARSVALDFIALAARALRRREAVA